MKRAMKSRTAAECAAVRRNYRLPAPAVLCRAGGLGVLPCDDDCLMSVLDARGHLRSIQIKSAPATYTELNVPVKIPKAMTQANGRMIGPAKKSNARVAASVVMWVRIDRGSVSLI